MATVTPAMISYPYGGTADETETIKFHTVISEAHQASAEITKFPVQTGFLVSNNSIRKNRVVNITGIITNVLFGKMVGRKAALADGLIQYSSNSASTIFEELERLINEAEPCEVVTNLGVYGPVVFTKFSTKQVAGMTDAMEFTIMGEELVVSGAVNGTTPKLLSFSELTGSKKTTRELLLREAGIEVCECNKISEANFTMGQDFVVDGVDSAGVRTRHTFLSTGQDPSTSSWAYEAHTSAIDLYNPEATSDIITAAEAAERLKDFANNTKGGFAQVSACLINEGDRVATELATDLIDTAMGELRKSLYGAVYETVHMTDNQYAQSLIQSGIGCLVRGITNADPKFPYTPGESLPRTDQILTAATKWGRDKLDPTVNNTNTGLTGANSIVTKVECCE